MARMSRPFKKLVAEDFGFHMSQQMLSSLASKELLPRRGGSGGQGGVGRCRPNGH